MVQNTDCVNSMICVCAYMQHVYLKLDEAVFARFIHMRPYNYVRTESLVFGGFWR